MLSSQARRFTIKILRRILSLVIVLIIYGSLYPWEFAPRQLPANPIWMLLTSWSSPGGRVLIWDVFINIALYVPLGTAAYFAFGKSWFAPVLIAAPLSAAVEVLQLYDAQRFTSMLDVVTNTAGAAAGAGLGAVFSHIMERHPHIRHRTHADLAAAGLLAGWALSFTFPLLPVRNAAGALAKFEILTHASLFNPVGMLSMAAVWSAAGWLLQAVKVRRRMPWLIIAALVLPLQACIATRQPLISDVLGALTGCGLFYLLQRYDRAFLRWIAMLFLITLTIRGLDPFHFRAAPQPFLWQPFLGALADEWQRSARNLIEKFCYYGTAIWILRATGLRLPAATLTATVLLGGIECAQMYLPGRTPESTDPIIAVLLGVLFSLVPAHRADGELSKKNLPRGLG